MKLLGKNGKQLAFIITTSMTFASSLALAQNNTISVRKTLEGEDFVPTNEIKLPKKDTLSANFEDINQDGFPDVVVLDENARTLSVYVSNGDGSLQDPSFSSDRYFELPNSPYQIVDDTFYFNDSDHLFTVDDDLKIERCEKNTVGSVSLRITGKPGDSFRNTLKCDGQVVAVCYATLPNKPTCKDGPRLVPVGGIKSCSIGESNSNSNAAKVISSTCG